MEIEEKDNDFYFQLYIYIVSQHTGLLTERGYLVKKYLTELEQELADGKLSGPLSITGH
jgi:hypothetical protein